MINVSPTIRSIIAVALLLFAGCKVLSVAQTMSLSNTLSNYAYLWFAGAFIFFHFLIFPKAIRANALYIEEHPEPYPIYHCLRPKTWIVMLIMIALGIGVRHSGLFDADFIIGFYSGLGISLVASIRFFISTIRKSISQ